MKHLVRHWEEIRGIIKDKKVFIFLDYDGTLAPIVNTPQEAKLSLEIRASLLKLVKKSNFSLAVISGRELREIKQRVNIKGIVYAGNHGLEIEGKGVNFKGLVSDDYRKLLKEIKRRLLKIFASFKGVIVEDKGLSISIHYRLAEKSRIPLIKKEIERVVKRLKARRNVELKEGKMVKEIMPKVKWDKGKAVKWILANKKGNYFPIYIGDDKTDEDAFRVVRKKGISIYVGKPKRSFAEYFLYDTQEVNKFLNKLLWLN
ncbi:MAG: trehalose-phosphatase [Candidatus Omnitrophica bacterium]|nr:trehalose-phosphatase [Candidatus Omnitrophota bacterium]